MLTLRDILLGIGLPTVISVLVVALLWRKRSARAWVGPIVVAISLVAAHVALIGKPSLRLPPLESQDWVFPAALVLALLAMIDVIAKPRWWIRLPLAVIAFAGFVTLLVLPMVKNQWATNESAGYIALATAAIGLSWLSLDAIARRGSPGPRLALLAMTAGLSAVMMLSSSVTMGQTCMALASTVWATTVLAGKNEKAAERVRGVLLVAVPLVAAMLIVGSDRVYAKISPENMGLILLPALTIWLAEIPPLSRWPKLRFTIALILALAPVVFAALHAHAQFVRDEAAMYGY